MIARVTQVSPLRVQEAAATVALPALRNAAYTPVLGDRVLVQHEGSQLVVVCALA